MPGPPKTPLALKVARGNPGKESIAELNYDQPTPEAALLDPPAWLNNEGKKEWKALAPLLFQNGLLTVLDYQILAILCSEFGRFVEFQKKLKKNPEKFPPVLLSPNGNPKANPVFDMEAGTMDRIYRLLQQFGMSPASRMKIRLPPGNKKDSQEDLWEQLVEKRRRAKESGVEK